MASRPLDGCALHAAFQPAIKEGNKSRRRLCMIPMAIVQHMHGMERQTSNHQQVNGSDVLDHVRRVVAEDNETLATPVLMKFFNRGC